MSRKSILLAVGVLTSILSTTLLTGLQEASADDWPQWRGPERDGVWRETGIIQKFESDQIEHKWRAEISNGYSSPTVANGRVYLMDRIADPDNLERVLCFDEETGEQLWHHQYESKYVVSYPDGPRAAVTINDGRAYSLGTMGHFRCLDAETGKVICKKDTNVDYKIQRPAFGVSAAPIVEGDLLIAQIGELPDGTVVAWDKETGEERWRALTDIVSYSAPIVIDQAGKRVLICWTANNVYGMNPENGDIYWTEETPYSRAAIAIADPVVQGDRLYLSSFYDGSYMFKLSTSTQAIEPVWRRSGRSERKTDALHSINSTPTIFGDTIYGVDAYGQFRGLDADNGDRFFEDLTIVPRSRWATVHITRNGDRHFLFNEKGELIIAELTPEGVNQISRAQLISPSDGQYAGTFSKVRKAAEAKDDQREGISMFSQDSGVVWTHPAYANKHVFIRNDNWLICADLSE
jgi:outer membrane protein assembly factor BamB